MEAALQGWVEVWKGMGWGSRWRGAIAEAMDPELRGGRPLGEVAPLVLSRRCKGKAAPPAHPGRRLSGTP